MKNKLLADTAKVKALSNHLAISERVRRFDAPGEPESWTIAVALKDIEESCNEIFQEQLPPLVAGNLSSSEIDERLHRIGEELRHILYHIHDSRYYAYLLSNDKNIGRGEDEPPKRRL